MSVSFLCFAINIACIMCIGLASECSSLGSLVQTPVSFEYLMPSRLQLSNQKRSYKDTSQIRRLSISNSIARKNGSYSQVTSTTAVDDMHQSRGFDIGNQMLIALVDFILARTEGQHFYFLYDQVFEDFSGPMIRLIKRKGDVSVFKCDSDLVELEAVIGGFYHMGHLRNIFVLCSSQNTVNVFKQITLKSLESRSVHWFVILKENIMKNISKTIREGTQISAAVSLGNKFKFWNSYIIKDNDIEFFEAGWWQWHPPTFSTTTEGTYTSSMKQPLYRPLDEVYSNFGGRVMRSAVVDNHPFFGVLVLPNSTVLPYSGIDLQVINTLAAKLNFSYQLVLAEDGEWGSLKNDGTFSGMIGKIEKRLAHFAIDEITITAVRERAVDFTLPYFTESTTLISPAPKQKNRVFAVFSPFTPEVWLMIAVTTLVMGPIITAVTWLRSKYIKDITELRSLSTFSFTAFRSLVIQGNLLNVRCFYHRSIFMAWFFFCVLIYALYAGTLTAVLTVPAYEKPIDSLWDLRTAIQEDGYKPVVSSIGSTILFTLQDATDGIYKQIWDLFTFPDGYVTGFGFGMGHKKVLTGKFVYIAAKLGSVIRAKRIGGLQKYYFARNTFLPQSYGIACPSGSPYRRIFGTLLVRMCSAGLINKWTDDVIAMEKSSLIEESKVSGAISLVHLQAAFFIALIGYSVALAVLIMEYVSNMYHKTHKKRSQDHF